jgi:hypothetical protein
LAVDAVPGTTWRSTSIPTMSYFLAVTGQAAPSPPQR